jgi:hypothetical protein
VLDLLVHHHAQAPADRAGFLRVARRGQARAHPVEVGVGESFEDGAYQLRAVLAHVQHHGERGTRIEVDADGRRVRGRIAGVGQADRIVRHRLVGNRAAHPGVGGENEMAQRLDEGPLVVDPQVKS